VEKQPSARVCFICGRENEVSLKADYYNDTINQQVVSEVTIPARFNGWPGHAHGGLVAALLDEAAFRAVWIDGNFQRAMVTMNLKIQLRRPTPTEQPLKTVGWVLEMDEARAKTASEIRLLDGTVVARGIATLVKPPDSFLEMAGWEEEEQYFKVYED
jgi:acyl-coenzyme A thioesterase PaaI-like protein